MGASRTSGSRTLLIAAMVLAAGALVAGEAAAGPTVDAIKARGKLRCGIPPASAGFATPDSQGVQRGFDADVCRAIAAAVLGDGEKIDFVPLNTNVRFQALQSGEIDVLSRQTTMTFSRENSLGLKFAPVVFYDGQGLMVNKRLEVDSAKKLDGAAICLLPGTTTEQNLADFFRTNNLKFESVVIESTDEWRNAFYSGRCDVITSDRSDLAAVRAVANNPADFVVLPETISKEPLGPVVRQGDDNWLNVVSWTVYALIAAEEKGITKANVEQMKGSKDPEVQRMLGVTDNLGGMMQLDAAWAVRAIKAVGNYGEMFEGNLGPKTPMGLTRGPNRLWTEGGLLYSPPFR